MPFRIPLFHHGSIPSTSTIDNPGNLPLCWYRVPFYSGTAFAYARRIAVAATSLDPDGYSRYLSLNQWPVFISATANTLTASPSRLCFCARRLAVGIAQGDKPGMQNQYILHLDQLCVLHRSRQPFDNHCGSPLRSEVRSGEDRS